MSLIIAIADTHGRTAWKKIVENTKADKIVFLGDYFDSHGGTTGEQQLETFIEILAFKRANRDNVVLLLGNHDYHYLHQITSTYSGFQQNYYKKFNSVLQSALKNDDIQLCFIADNVIYSHAGVTKTWLLNTFSDLTDDLEKSINDKFISNPDVFDFTIGTNYSIYGDDITQTPLWVRVKSLYYDCIDGYKQVVGHTPFKTPIIVEDKLGFIDCLEDCIGYAEVRDGDLKVTIIE